jgi:hypothetical protein
MSYLLCAGVGIVAAVTVAYFVASPPSGPEAAAVSAQPTTRPGATKPAACDVLGKMIRDRLAPGRRMPEDLAGLVVEQKQAEARKGDLLSRPLVLAAEIRRAPVVRPTTRRALSRVRGAEEAPALASAAQVPRPGLPQMAAGSRYAVETPAPVSPLLRLPLVVRPRPEPVIAPLSNLLDELGRPALSVLPSFRTTAAGFVRLTIPDPLENENAIKVMNEPGEEDAPTMLRSRPTTPALPVVQPAPAPGPAPTSAPAKQAGPTTKP